MFSGHIRVGKLYISIFWQLTSSQGQSTYFQVRHNSNWYQAQDRSTLFWHNKIWSLIYGIIPLTKHKIVLQQPMSFSMVYMLCWGITFAVCFMFVIATMSAILCKMEWCALYIGAWFYLPTSMIWNECFKILQNNIRLKQWPMLISYNTNQMPSVYAHSIRFRKK